MNASNAEQSPAQEEASPGRRPRAPRSRAGGVRIVWVSLFLILSLALALRLYGIDWDQGGLFHPDERAILTHVNDLELPSPGEIPDLIDAEKSPLNPGWFNYGSLPLYMLKAVEVAAAPFTDWSLFDLRIPGRAISALSDTVTVGLIFLFGRAWLGNRVALLASLLGALAVIDIQLSHFFAVDTFLTTFTAAALFFMVRVAYGGRRRDSALAGAFVGLAMATKVSASVLGAPLVASHLIYAISRHGDAFRLAATIEASRPRIGHAFSGLVLAGLLWTIAFSAGQPYTFFDFSTFKENVSEQSEMVRREVDYPYTRQYIDTPKYLYQAWQIGAYGLGPVLGAVSWIGLGAAAIFALRRRRKLDLVIFSWLVPYLLVTGWFDVKFMRYLLPTMPFLLLYGSQLLLWGGRSLRRWRPSLRYAGPAMIGLVVAFTAHYALAYETIYAQPHPAQEAAQWLEENAKSQSLILKEHWDEGVSQPSATYREDLELYNPDTSHKFERISSQLARGDYLVLFSNRLYATIPRLEERYPISRRYYEKLFSGELGYRLAHVSRRVPGALGISYDEATFARSPDGPPKGYEPVAGGLATVDFGWADESFSVYDHPKTLIFKNSQRLSSREIFNQIMGEEVRSRPKVGLLLSEEDWAQQRSGGTYGEIVDLGDGANAYAWLVWLLAVQAIGLAALPLTLVVFRPLPGRGYLLSKILGLLLVAFIAWLLASVELVTFSRGSVLLALLMIAAVSAVVAWKQREELLSFLREHRRFILGMEAVFLLAFLSFLAIRMANPDLWHPWRGGEKPMDFAYLVAVTRSSVMPPFDPWFAGGFLNYYYFGQFIIASLIRLTGIQPAVAYNLAVPMLFALTAGGAFAVVYALAEGARKATGLSSLSGKGPVLAGLSAAILVAAAGNIDGLIQVVEGGGRALFQDEPFGGFDYWRSSRMFAPGSGGHEITEFPFFTFLYGDLHAHMIAIPFTLLAIGLAVAIYLSAASRESRWPSRIPAALLLGLTVGGLRIMNAWDYPTYLGVGAAAILLGELLNGGVRWKERILSGMGLAVAMGVLTHLAYLPFHLNFELFNNGVERSQFQTPLWRYWMIHAPFLFLILSYVLWQGRRVAPAVVARLGLSAEWALLYAAVPVAGLIAVGALGFSTIAFTLGLVVVIGALTVVGLNSASRRVRYEVVVAGMAMLALAIGAGVDLVTVKDDIGRMNTVFKFYLQAWILMALASGYLLWRFGSAGMFSLRRFSAPRAAWAGAAAILGVAVMVYPALGTEARIEQRFNPDFLGIDGAAYMDDAVYRLDETPIELKYDKHAIQWLQENVEGSPVIVEGLTDLYQWGNRVSINTGLPTIVGWDWHQRQQRVAYAWAVRARRSDVERIYSSPDPQVALKLMRDYDARYLYLGKLERAQYPEAGLQKFEHMADEGLIPVYQNEEVTIFELGDGLAVSETGPSGQPRS